LERLLHHCFTLTRRQTGRLRTTRSAPTQFPLERSLRTALYIYAGFRSNVTPGSASIMRTQSNHATAIKRTNYHHAGPRWNATSAGASIFPTQRPTQPPLQRVAPTHPPLQRKIKLGIQKNGYPTHAGLRSNAEYVHVFHWNELPWTNYRGSITSQVKAHYSPQNANYLRCLYVATHPENGSFFKS
jgi:hypothetical protein